MNRQQWLDVVKGVLVTGGPVGVILVNLFGMEPGAAERIVQGLGALASVAGIVWLAIGRTDLNMVKAAASVPGAQVHVDTRIAPPAVVNAALSKSPEVKDVVPMVGPPRNEKEPT